MAIRFIEELINLTQGIPEIHNWSLATFYSVLVAIMSLLAFLKPNIFGKKANSDGRTAALPIIATATGTSVSAVTKLFDSLRGNEHGVSPIADMCMEAEQALTQLDNNALHSTGQIATVRLEYPGDICINPKMIIQLNVLFRIQHSQAREALHVRDYDYDVWLWRRDGERVLPVIETLNRLFPDEACPDHIVYDRGCFARAYVHNPDNRDRLVEVLGSEAALEKWKEVGFYVDRFHFTGHSKSDQACRDNCNPYSIHAPFLTCVLSKTRIRDIAQDERPQVLSAATDLRNAWPRVRLTSGSRLIYASGETPMNRCQSARALSVPVTVEVAYRPTACAMNRHTRSRLRSDPRWRGRASASGTPATSVQKRTKCRHPDSYVTEELSATALPCNSTASRASSSITLPWATDPIPAAASKQEVQRYQPPG
ncbi:hypothetical protein VOLCADRAFT_95168 [Volvox carteri f. nagariensis]|uniref:Uncharacterized protein n=1 Tax=Volvox carteri f. nagariensis TaxID=3068 RepID=D8U6S7_VOLCA|nr:uncharacterized protein VOLCADRAFT_95168 [Volvox carteri f. nagariensis]EFJ44562.1 hypothetical protein VOLCADRAFT_95168 [Volvox carteri f. nagariensis]|eukprot:XP_002954412.1 hypothetical protein VOLCADRAFT_95168 [Volvox carteri f. nagariensis]